jgi:hypothetical protein
VGGEADNGPAATFGLPASSAGSDTGNDPSGADDVDPSAGGTAGTSGSASATDGAADLDSTAGPAPVCGDGTADPGELCDGDDVAAASCASEGFDSGDLTCEASCQALDTSGCGTCGNAIVDGAEPCDGGQLASATCASEGFDSGTIACQADCAAFDVSGCGTCGNGTHDGDEACDGADLDGMTCASFGLLGPLGCDAACEFDTSSCTIPSETVDFPVAADPRSIQSGTLPWHAGDWFEGVRATGIASLGQLDIHLVIVNNGLTACGSQPAQVTVNGQVVGSFTVMQGTAVIDMSYPAVPAIAGPVYTVRYQTTATVASGCGAAGYAEVGSTVTFNGA